MFVYMKGASPQGNPGSEYRGCTGSPALLLCTAVTRLVRHNYKPGAEEYASRVCVKYACCQLPVPVHQSMLCPNYWVLPTVCFFFFFSAPESERKTPVHTYFSSFRVPVRTRFVSSTLVGAACGRHESPCMYYNTRYSSISGSIL